MEEMLCGLNEEALARLDEAQATGRLLHLNEDVIVNKVLDSTNCRVGFSDGKGARIVFSEDDIEVA